LLELVDEPVGQGRPSPPAIVKLALLAAALVRPDNRPVRRVTLIAVGNIYSYIKNDRLCRSSLWRERSGA